MQVVDLTKGYAALVDDEDYERVSRYKWQVIEKKRQVYAARCRRRSEGPGPYRIYLHWEVLGQKERQGKGQVVDHINRNGLDCQKENLRVCSRSENAANRGPSRQVKTSKYKGVFWIPAHGYHQAGWVAKIRHQRKRYYLGFFRDEFSAVKAYNVAAYRLFGRFAYLNKWDEGGEDEVRSQESGARSQKSEVRIRNIGHREEILTGL